MRLPRYTATTPPPRISGLARATNIGALTQTSEQAKQQGIGAFGQGLAFAGQLAFSASLHRQALDDDVESGLFTQKSQERISLGVSEVTNFDWNTNMPKVGDPDYYEILNNYNTDERDKYGKLIYDGIADDIEKQIASIKSPRVRADKEKWWLENQIKVSDKIRHFSALNHEDYIGTQMEKMGEDAAQNGDLDTANMWANRMDEHNLRTSQAAERLKKRYKVIADMSVAYKGAQAVMALEGHQKAVDYVMAQDIDIDIKKSVIRDINFDASQQKLAYEKQLEQIEVGYLAKLRKEDLSENEVMADLQAGRIDPDLYKEYVNYIDAQVEERLKGTKEQDWDTYDELQGMVKEYGDGARTDERFIRGKISEAVKARKITSTNGMKLLDRVKKSDDKDDPMNRSDVKRGLSVLTDLESFEVAQAKKDDADFEEIREIRLTYQKKMDEYEGWIRGQEKLTDKDIQTKTKEMTELEVEEITLNWLERLMFTKRPQLFGLVGTQKERLANKKIKEMQELDKWEGLTPDEQETIRQAFLAGKSIQDVLDIMGQ